MTPEIEISQAALDSLPNCLLVDMRDAESVAYGMIPGAVALPQERLEAEVPARCAGRPVVLYCARGQFSVDAAEDLRRLGVEAYSLEGGYAGWLLYRMQREQETSLQQQIEEGIRKTWHKRLFSKFAKAIRTYDLVKPGDRIAVCISGGKDSMLMAKLFQELQRHHKFPFELTISGHGLRAITQTNRKMIEHNARSFWAFPVTIFETRYLRRRLQGTKRTPATCAPGCAGGICTARRKELGCNKIALGHHYDDVIETILMGMLYGAQMQTMMPKLHSTNFPGMELIRPMYLIREADIKALAGLQRSALHPVRLPLHRYLHHLRPERHARVSKRMEIKQLIAEMKKINPIRRGQHFPQHGEREPEHGHFLQAGRSGAFLP